MDDIENKKIAIPKYSIGDLVKMTAFFFMRCYGSDIKHLGKDMKDVVNSEYMIIDIEQMEDYCHYTISRLDDLSYYLDCIGENEIILSESKVYFEVTYQS